MKWPDTDIRAAICANPILGDHMHDFILTFKRLALLDKIKLNRASHQRVYAAATITYHKLFIAELTSRLDSLAICEASGKLTAPVRFTSKLAVPEEHLDEYDELISMLELTSQEDIPLTQYQYKQYVLDQWDWSRSFVSNTLSYGGLK